MILREYEAGDCRETAELFYHTVHKVNTKDYTEEQLNAWAPKEMDLEKWNRLLQEHFSIVAMEDKAIVGFGDVDDAGCIDHLFVHKDYQRRGIASALCKKLEQKVQGRMTTHASVTARPFFEKIGYRVIKEQQVERQGIFLTNYIMIKEQIRAAFFDIDGTLAEMRSHAIPDSTREAIRRLREKGIFCILSTGRHPLEVEEENILPGLSFDGGIWLTGQYCELHGKCICQNCFTGKQLAVLKEFLERRGRSCIFLEKDAMYCNLVDERIRKEQEKIGTAVPPVRDLNGLETRQILQAVPYIDEEEERELTALLPECKLTRWGEGVVDFLPPGGGKEQGILAVCEALGITPAQVIAFGDAENDIAMLHLVGIGVAMGNGGPGAKEAADYVTDRIEEDGIWKALVKFGIIEAGAV